MFDWYPAQEELGHPSHVLGFLPGAESGNSEFRAYYEFISVFQILMHIPSQPKIA